MNSNVKMALILYFVLIVSVILLAIIRASIIERKIEKLTQNALEVSPEEMMKLRAGTLKGKGQFGGKVADDYKGVYIIYNKNKKKYYVGQASRVLQRLNQHFTGHGNGDVYADYKYGDSFTIKTIALESSGYNSLDKLEKDTIKVYDAFGSGYNKTRGNKS